MNKQCNNLMILFSLLVNNKINCLKILKKNRIVFFRNYKKKSTIIYIFFQKNYIKFLEQKMKKNSFKINYFHSMCQNMLFKQQIYLTNPKNSIY